MTSDRDIVIVEAELNDETIAQLKSLEADVDPEITECIKGYLQVLSVNEPDKEIFAVGKHYIITETGIYIAVYEDELDTNFET